MGIIELDKVVAQTAEESCMDVREVRKMFISFLKECNNEK